MIYQELYNKVWSNRSYHTHSPELAAAETLLGICRKHGVKRVLAVGCGQGHGVKHLLDAGLDAYGVDVSDVALKAHPELKGRVRRMDFTACREPIFGPVDLVYSIDVLEHIHEEHLDGFFRAVQAQQPKAVYFEIATKPDVFGPALAGEPLHVTVHPRIWWEHVVDTYFDLAEGHTHRDSHVTGCSVLAHFDAQNPKPGPASADAWVSRHEDARRNVLQFSRTPVAGAAAAIALCTNKYLGWDSFCVATQKYIDGRHFPIEKTDGKFRAEVVHLHNRTAPPKGFVGPLCVMYHSDPDVSHLGHRALEKEGWPVGIIPQGWSRLFGEEKENFDFLPNLIDIDHPLLRAVERDWSGKLRIAYSPSLVAATQEEEDRLVGNCALRGKGYVKTREILDRLEATGLFEVDIITGVPIHDCLRRKQQAHIVIDECVTGLYHRSSLEGLSQGAVVFNAVDDYTRGEFEKIAGKGRLPFISTPIEELENQLRALEKDRDAAADLGRYARTFMETRWHPKRLLENCYLPFWQKAQQTFEEKSAHGQARHYVLTGSNDGFDKVVHACRKSGAKRVLVVGCDDGEHLQRLLDEGFDAYGLAINPDGMTGAASLKERVQPLDLHTTGDPAFGAIDFLYTNGAMTSLPIEKLDAFLRTAQRQKPKAACFDLTGLEADHDGELQSRRSMPWWSRVIGDYFKVKDIPSVGERFVFTSGPVENRRAAQRDASPADPSKGGEYRYRRNLEILRARSSDAGILARLDAPEADYRAAGLHIAFAPTEACFGALQIGDQILAIDDANDPAAHARDWARSQQIHTEHGLIFLIGFGFGYAAEALLNLIGPDAQLVVLEPYSALLKAAMEHRDLRHVFSDARFHLLLEATGEDVKSTIRAITKKNASLRNFHPLVRNSYAALMGEEAVEHSRTAMTNFDVVLRMRMTMHNAGRTWDSQTLTNLHWAVDHPGMEALMNVEDMDAAIIVGAGPTLKDSMEFLRRMQDRVPILASDSAVPKLLAEGIHPHLSLAVDPKEAPMKSASKLDPEKTGVLLSHHVHPGYETMPALFKAVCLPPNWNAKLTPGGERKTWDNMMFVGGTAADAAVKMGARTLYLVGMDFAFAPDGTTHVKGALPQNLMDLHTRDEWLPVDGYTHPKLRTSHMFKHYLDQFCLFVAQNPGVKFVPVTSGGAKIGDLEHMLPQDALPLCDRYEPRDWRTRFKARVEDARERTNTPAQRRRLQEAAAKMVKLDKALRATDNCQKIVDLLAMPGIDKVLEMCLYAVQDVFDSINAKGRMDRAHLKQLRERLDGIMPLVRHLADGTAPSGDADVVRFKFRDEEFRFHTPNADDHIQRFHRHGKFFEPNELAFIEEQVKPGAVIVEVGANIGNHVVYYDRFLKPEKVLLVEPNPEAIAILTRNLELNGCKSADTSKLGMGVGAERGRFHLHAPETNNLGAVQLKAGSDGAVEVLPLDELVGEQHVDFVKIDVENMEMEVLQGARKLIERARPSLFVEVRRCNIEAFETFVADIGYQTVHRFDLVNAVNFFIAPK